MRADGKRKIKRLCLDNLKQVLDRCPTCEYNEAGWFCQVIVSPHVIVCKLFKSSSPINTAIVLFSS